MARQPPLHKLQPLVEALLSNHATLLPDLQRLVVIMPGPGVCQPFHQLLLQQLPAEHNALIPPYCGTLENWLQQLLPTVDATPVSAQARRLMFIEALSQHPGLFRADNKWQVCDALLQLFDELSLQHATIPDSIEAWNGFLQQTYAADEAGNHLQFEARLVHTLWQAWQQQLNENRQLDATRHYLRQLSQLKSQTDAVVQDIEHIYIVEQPFHRAEQQTIDALLACGKASMVDCESHCLHSSNGRFIQQCYDHGTALLQRAESFPADTPPSIRVFISGDDEIEVAAIDLQIRQWLLAGKNPIGVICEDRRLARRLRALLERAALPLQDLAGWSLATTSAAAVIERWLECIEQDFDHQPFLDLLKSRFISLSEDDESFLHTVYRFEQDIILQENIHSRLGRYRRQLELRKQRLTERLHWPLQQYRQLQHCLEQIEVLSAPLLQLCRSTRSVAASVLFNTVRDSLQALGIIEKLQHDAAGQSVLQCLDEMQASLLIADPTMSWQDFRVWLGTALETTLFRPWQGSSPVKLMTLEQSVCHSFDAVILASVNAGSFPGSPPAAPVFNQSVHHALGLRDWRWQQQHKFRCFRQALLSADEVLITCKDHDNGDPRPLSPWVESLLRFHQLAFGRSAVDSRLHDELITLQTARQQACQGMAPTTQAQAVIEAGDIPQRLSAGAHQRLIECPYRFFASDVLALRATEEISRELQKPDYGNRIHTILHAFHKQLAHYPPPFAEPLSPANRDAAIEHLDKLSQQVFRSDMEQNIMHRSWLAQWQKHIPAYIDWQIQQAENWRVDACEHKAQAALTANVELYGILDRIDRHVDKDQGYAIIDYKTGKAPHQDAVDSGENVQLASYSLLQDKTCEVMYVSLDEKHGQVKTASSLEGEHLDAVRDAVANRLRDILQKLQQQHPLPAWGDDKVCRHCDFSGMCRRQYWHKSG